jgi:peptidyl-prolyl cis-trans isomerase SurA
MKNRHIILLYLFLACTINNITYAKNENKIIIKVQNQIITNYEIKNKILTNLVLSNQEINQENINNLKRQTLDFLLSLKLKKIELSKHNFKKDNQQINNYLKRVSSNDIDGLKKKFEINKLSYNLFIDEIETEFKWQKLIYKIYSRRIQIDEKNIQKELENLIKNQKNIDEFRISEIEILSNNINEEKEYISFIKKQIETIGFEDAALKFSASTTAANKGDLGWINSQSLSKKMFNIISKMSIGEISKPIERPNGILFLKLQEKKTSNTNELDINKLKIQLIDQKKNELFGLYSRSHLSKIRNNSLIEYK